MTTRVVDLGHGVTARLVSCAEHGSSTGAIVAFGRPGTPGFCEGLIGWCSCYEPAWRLVELDPLHVEPSVACGQHPEHHGFIRNGRWEPC